MRIGGEASAAVGGTPLVALRRLGEGLGAEVCAKLEYFNPGGSVKDRIGVAMIDAAEAEGAIERGRSVIVEPTSGNTGIALAMVCAARGYELILTLPEGMSRERAKLLRAYGAEVRETPSLGGMTEAVQLAERIREQRKGFMPQQFSNPANPEIHRRTTAEEIWEDCDGEVGAFVAGVGTGGTITGVGRYLKSQNPKVTIVGADPAGSVYSGGSGRPYLVEGVGEDFWPTTYDPSVVDRVVEVTDAESFTTARRVTCEEGLLIGGSGGTAVHAAMEVGRELGPGDVVVVLLPDSGRNYLSKVFDDQWMMDFGFLRAEGPTAGDVLAAKSRDIPDLVLITPDEPARRAIELMHSLGISQVVVSVTKELPLAAKEISGVVVELPLMDRAFSEPAVLDRPVKALMGPPMPMRGIGEPVSALVADLDRAPSVIVLDGGHPVGVLSRSDVLSFLAARSPG
jgi:cystathionine beta-synthase